MLIVMISKYLALLNGTQCLPKTDRLPVIYLTKMGLFRINKSCNSGSATMVSYVQVSGNKEKGTLIEKKRKWW